MNGSPLIWGVLLLVVSGMFMASALRRRFPLAFWLVSSWPVLWWRMRSTWHALVLECDLTTMREPSSALLGGLVVKGRELRPNLPRLTMGFPQHFRVTARVRLLPGQTPDDYTQAADAMVHTWRVHAVRVASSERGFVELAVTARDPLATVVAVPIPVVPGPRKAPEDPVASLMGWIGDPMQVQVGMREDGKPWILDLKAVPHWLICGATLSGKSTLLNAIVVQLAPQPVALVGVDLKGGLELSPYLPRLSALATTRTEAGHLFNALFTLVSGRMDACLAAGVRNIWALPEPDRPVPVVVIVDEIAELFLATDRAGKQEAEHVTTTLVRLAQLGASLGLHLIIAGQRLGSDLGPGATALRAQLGGRVCHRVNDAGTAEMTLGDVFPDAVDAAQTISPYEKGVAITTAETGTWLRARSGNTSADHAQRVAADHAYLRWDLFGIGGTGNGSGSR